VLIGKRSDSFFAGSPVSSGTIAVNNHGRRVWLLGGAGHDPAFPNEQARVTVRYVMYLFAATLVATESSAPRGTGTDGQTVDGGGRTGTRTPPRRRPAPVTATSGITRAATRA
jgi:hypothetical protein